MSIRCTVPFVLALLTWGGVARADQADEFESMSDTTFGEMTVEAARAYGNARYDEAFRDFKRLACGGDKASQAMVGRMYLAGEGVTRNDLEGYVWLKLAAEFNFGSYRSTAKKIESLLTPEQVKVTSAREAVVLGRYGLRATNMSCNQHASVSFSSTVKDTVLCTPKREGTVVRLHRCAADDDATSPLNGPH